MFNKRIPKALVIILNADNKTARENWKQKHIKKKGWNSNKRHYNDRKHQHNLSIYNYIPKYQCGR